MHSIHPVCRITEENRRPVWVLELNIVKRVYMFQKELLMTFVYLEQTGEHGRILGGGVSDRLVESEPRCSD
jgi:hypothetical protein